MPREQLNSFLLRCWVVHNQAKFHGRGEEQVDLRRLIERITTVLRLTEESPSSVEELLEGVLSEIRQIYGEMPEDLRKKLPELPRSLCPNSPSSM